MNSLHGIIPVGPQTWKGARAIAIDALPGTLAAGLQGDILVRCQREKCSVELCLATDRDAPGTVTALILLRSLGSYPYEVLDRLERLSAMILQRLSAASILCRAVAIDSPEARRIERFFGGELAGVCAAEGFFPAEGAPNPSGIYVPGGYAVQGARPVALDRLTTVLSAYPDALIMLQLNITRLSPPEQRLVRDNLSWFSQRPEDSVTRAGREAFARLNRVASQPLFMTALTCLGSHACVRDVAAQMELSGLHSYRLPRIDARGGSYLYRGNEWLTELCARCGHDLHCLPRVSAHLQRLTHLAPLEAACAAFALPQYTREIRGIRVNRIPASREPLPTAMTRPGGVYLGRHIESGLPVSVPPDELSRHGFFVGKPGSGKTTFALGLLYRLYNHPNKYPFLAFEPAKTEYRSLMERIPELRVYTPGREDVAPMQLNPFLPPRGVRLDQYQQNLETIFAMAISMDHPLDIIFPQVISRCYARYGWRPNSTRDSAGVRPFGMHEFIREFRRYIHEHYGGDPESEHNLENGGVVRLMALMQSPMFDTNRSLDVETLLSRPTVIELDALNSPGQKALVMGVLLVQIMLALQQRGTGKGRLKNVILIDEAHLLLSQNDSARDSGPGRAVVESLQNMTLILRDYGTALLFGDQSPARLTNVILDNVELKVMFRLDSRQDRAILENSARLDGDMGAALAALNAGEAYLHCTALNAPIHISTPDTHGALKLTKGLSDDQVRQRMRVAPEPPFTQCAQCGACDGRCDPNVRADGRFLADRLMDRPEVTSCLTNPERQNGLTDFLGAPMIKALDSLIGEYGMDGDEPRLPGCARAQFIRALLIHPRFILSEEALTRPDGGPDAAESPNLFQSGITPENILELCARDPDKSDPS